MRTETIAGLDVVIAGGTDKKGGGNGLLVVLLHGYGAGGHDLVPLWRELDVPREVRFAFPAAPHALPFIYGESRAWWMIDVSTFQQAAATGRLMEMAEETPPGLVQVRSQMSQFVNELEALLNAPPEKMMLGGFSQGAVTACDTILHSDHKFAGMIMLSGALMAAREWRPRMKKHNEMPVFIAHGIEDTVVPFEFSSRLRDEFERAGAKVEWIPFHGDHTIAPSALDRLGFFIQRAALGLSLI